LNKQNDFETCANLRKKQFQLVVHVWRELTQYNELVRGMQFYECW
jgi:hypothetical protein